MGQSPRLRLTNVQIDQNDKLHVLGGASWGRSPLREKDPNVIHG